MNSYCRVQTEPKIECIQSLKEIHDARCSDANDTPIFETLEALEPETNDQQ